MPKRLNDISYCRSINYNYSFSDIFSTTLLLGLYLSAEVKEQKEKGYSPYQTPQHRINSYISDLKTKQIRWKA